MIRAVREIIGERIAMPLPDPLLLIAVIFALLGIAFLIMTIAVLRRKKFFSTVMNFVLALLLLSLSALFGTITLAIQGYHALTREDVAATVQVEPQGEQRFLARIILPDGKGKTFSLNGDQLYIDAHILKWKPLANFLGLHTSYQLDRIGGRYANISDETAKAHTVFPLSENGPLDMFDLRRRFAFLNPLLDTEYGSATFINTSSAEEFRVMVSTTGLLIRKNEKDNRPGPGKEAGGKQ